MASIGDISIPILKDEVIFLKGSKIGSVTLNIICTYLL